MIFIKISEMFGSRHYMTFMLFLGMANAYIMRTNMSIAIVSMVWIYYQRKCSTTASCLMDCRLITRRLFNMTKFLMMNAQKLIMEKKAYVINVTSVYESIWGHLLFLLQEHLDGEFVWSSSVQGYILASFFYGMLPF